MDLQLMSHLHLGNMESQMFSVNGLLTFKELLKAYLRAVWALIAFLWFLFLMRVISLNRWNMILNKLGAPNPSVDRNIFLQVHELISEFVLEGHWGPGEWLFVSQRAEKDRGAEGHKEASKVAVMAFQVKLRHGEMFGSASAECWPLFTQVVSTSWPSHSRHNSFSS